MVDWLRSSDTRVALVGLDAGVIAGFVLVVPYATAPAYRGVGEYMIYVARDARGRGTGKVLLEAACREAERLGHWKLVGKLFDDNRESIELARRCGFVPVGVHRRHGRLDGRWRDVLVLERLLGEGAAG